MESLSKLHTVQMEGNPVWSVAEYTYHLVTSLPGLSVLDQQEISAEVRTNAERWKEAQVSSWRLSRQVTRDTIIFVFYNVQAAASAEKPATGARKQLLKKMEERNVSISNAKQRCVP